MKISQTAEYALRAVVWLAREPAASVGTQHIAKATHVPAGYLARVLQSLARAGLLESTPGRAGGFRLRRAPAEISVLDVVNAVDPVQRIVSCPLGLKAHRGHLCPLHRRLDDAAASVERAFAATNMAEIVAETRPVPALCQSESHPGRKEFGAGPLETRK
jgi:Rrf2 family protein